MSRFSPPSSIISAALVAGLLLGACSSQPIPATPAPPSALGNDTIREIYLATQGGDFKLPQDSIPDPEGKTIYFTATGSQGPGVFQVPVAGGTATVLFSGAPFVAPVGIGISHDGQRIFVADPQASSDGKTGQIWVLPVAGGPPAALSGTAGTAPRGMDLVQEGGQEIVYFTGNDPANGQAAVLKVSAGGGALSVVAGGAPLVAPDGVTVSHDGVVYVSDHGAGDNGQGRVWAIRDGRVSPLVPNVRLGDPAGIALTPDDALLVVSALQPDRDSDQVLLVDVASGQTGSVTKVVEANDQAGGVHRAHNSALFSWCGISRGAGGGGIYVVNP